MRRRDRVDKDYSIYYWGFDFPHGEMHKQPLFIDASRRRAAIRYIDAQGVEMPMSGPRHIYAEGEYGDILLISYTPVEHYAGFARMIEYHFSSPITAATSRSVAPPNFCHNSFIIISPRCVRKATGTHAAIAEINAVPPSAVYGLKTFCAAALSPHASPFHFPAYQRPSPPAL